MPYFRDFLSLPRWVARYELRNYGVRNLLIKQVRDLQVPSCNEIHAKDDLPGQWHSWDQ